jgi:hypothetical protein
MMIIRNNVYTVFNGQEVELYKNEKGLYYLIFRGINNIENGFMPVNVIENVFVRQCKINDEITNGYEVNTYAEYKSFTFQVDRADENRLRLTTSEAQAYNELELEMIDRGWYEKWVNKNNIDKIWNQRKPSSYGLPMPDTVEPYKQISL